MLELMNEAVQKMSRGELSQLRRSRKREFSIEGYYSVIEGKTAALLSASTAAGALSAGAAGGVVQQFKRFGERLGMAFQVRDDMLDYSTSEEIGKSTGNDLQEGKYTLPVLHALGTLSQRERRAMIAKLNRARVDAAARREVSRFVVESGGLDASALAVRRFVDEGKEALREVPDSEARRSLFALADYMVERKK